MKKTLIYVISAALFGFFATAPGCQVAYASDESRPILNFAAFAPVVHEGCDCGPDCDCGPNCQCGHNGIEFNGLSAWAAVNSVGCGRASRRQQQQADQASNLAVFDPQQNTAVQLLPAAASVATDPDVCPCYGMKMNAEQKATYKARLPVTQASPLTTTPIMQQTSPVVTYQAGGFFGGNCVGGNCAGNNCGTGRAGLFRRR